LIDFNQAPGFPYGDAAIQSRDVASRQIGRRRRSGPDPLIVVCYTTQLRKSPALVPNKHWK
jgi:hypothetical protein